MIKEILNKTSARFVMTLPFVFTACYMVVAGIEVPEFFVALVVSVVSFWFGTRNDTTSLEDKISTKVYPTVDDLIKDINNKV